MRKLALGFVILLVALAFLAVFAGHGVTILIDGQPLSGLFGGMVGIGGLLVAVVALFCAAIVLALVFAGVWLLLTGIAVVIVFVLFSVMAPFLLPLLIPLGLVWLLVVMLGGENRERIEP